MQILKTVKFPCFTKKAYKNHDLLKLIVTQCQTYRDYEVVLKLLSTGEYKNTSGIDLENLVHRLGKVLDIKLLEEKESNNAPIQMS